jgi:hypothetical protein
MKRLLLVMILLIGMPIGLMANDASFYSFDMHGWNLLGYNSYYDLQIAQTDAKAKVSVMGAGVEDIKLLKAGEIFNLTGNVELHAEGNNKDGTGADIRQESKSIYESVIDLNGGYKGYDGRAKIYITSEDEPDAQRRHKLEFDMNTPWGAINFGDQVVDHSSLTLSGKRITDAEVGLEIDKHEVSIFGGQANKAIEETGVYARTLGGIKGRANIKDDYAISFIYLSGSDDEESVDSSNYNAYKSGVFGIGAEANPWQSLTASFEVASSNTEKVTPKDSTIDSKETAIKGEFKFDNRKYLASFGYSSIPKGYYTPGNPYLLDNLKHYDFKLGSYFAQQKYYTAVSINWDEDIDSTKSNNATRAKLLLDLNTKPGGVFPNIYLTYSRQFSFSKNGQKFKFPFFFGLSDWEIYNFNVTDNFNFRLMKSIKTGKINNSLNFSYSLSLYDYAGTNSYRIENDYYRLSISSSHPNGISASLNLATADRYYAGAKTNQNDIALRADWRPVKKSYSLFLATGFSNSNTYNRTNAGGGLTWNLAKNQSFELTADALNYNDDDDNSNDYNLMNWRSVYRYRF